MYLVKIEGVKKSDESRELVFSPCIEKLQSFSYQLRSQSWSVIDCVPEKGAAFELHLSTKYYSDKHGPNDVAVAAAFIAPCVKTAISSANMALQYLARGTKDYADVFTALDCGVVYLYFQGDVLTSSFSLRNREVSAPSRSA